VERAIKVQQGIQKVRANARNQLIEVLFDAATIDAAVIAKQISKVGYQTKIVSPTPV
jgi:copper chaperone